MDKRAFVFKELDDKISVFDKESTRHKQMYRRMRYGIFVLTALSTLLAALSISFPESNLGISLGIVAVSALIGLITSLEGLHNPADLWVHERSILYALIDLKREALFRLGEDKVAHDIEAVFEQMQRILGHSAENWHQQIANPDKPATGTT